MVLDDDAKQVSQIGETHGKRQWQHWHNWLHVHPGTIAFLCITLPAFIRVVICSQFLRWWLFWNLCNMSGQESMCGNKCVPWLMTMKLHSSWMLLAWNMQHLLHFPGWLLDWAKDDDIHCPGSNVGKFQTFVCWNRNLDIQTKHNKQN